MNIFIRPHFFGGKNNTLDRTFVPLCIRSVMKHNPDNDIYFVSNDPTFLGTNFPEGAPRLHCFLFEDIEDELTRQFLTSYVHLSHNQLQFEKYCIAGYFIIKTLMERLSLDGLS